MYKWFRNRSLCQHIMHGVESRRLSGQIFGRFDGALSENCAAVGPVGEGDDLILSGKDHIVVPDDRAAADCRDADLLLRALLTPGTAVIDILIAAVHGIVDAVGERKCCPAGRIHLLVVVFLHDLNVKASRRQPGGSLREKGLQQVDPKGNIGALEDRDLSAVFLSISVWSSDRPVVHTTTGSPLDSL